MRSQGTSRGNTDMVPGEVPVMQGESKGDSPEFQVGDIVEVEWAMGRQNSEYHDAWIRILRFSDSNPKVFIGELFLGNEHELYSHVNVSRLIHADTE